MPRREVVLAPGGRRLSLTISGPATPVAIVLEAGLGASGGTWGPVQQLTSRHVRTISYDRAGYGRSDRTTASRTLDDLACDLGVVVDAVDAERVVLVGHSWGGPIVRTYARTNRARLAGILLVDPSEEDAELHFGHVRGVRGRLGDTVLPALVHLALFLRSAFSVMAGTPRALWWDAVAGSITPRALVAMVREERQVVPGLLGLREHDDPVDDVPLCIISAQVDSRVERGLRHELVQAHRRRVERAGGTLVLAHHSKHMVPTSEPGLVAEHALGLTGL